MSESPVGVDSSGEVLLTELPNGLRVVTERMDSVRSVTLGCWVGVGNRDEPAQHAGSSHFLEHLLFKGSAQWSTRDLSVAIDGVGGDMNAFTSREYTAYSFRVPHTSLALAAELLGEVITRPTLDADDLESERLVIQEELTMAEDTPDDLVHMELQESLFPGHPLGREVLGSVDTIEHMTAETVRGFHGHWYQPANMVIAAAGLVDHQELVDAMSAKFAAQHGGERPARMQPDAGVRRVTAIDKPVEQTHVAFGWRGFGLDDERRFALSLANQILGGSLSSRLFHEIREKRGLAYSVFSSSSSYLDAGILTMYAGTSPEKTRELLDVVDAEIQELIDNGFTAEELATAKGGVSGATMMGLEDSSSRMGRLGSNILLFDRVKPLDEAVAAIERVDLDELNAVAAEVFSADRALSLVGPDATNYI